MLYKSYDLDFKISLETIQSNNMLQIKIQFNFTIFLFTALEQQAFLLDSYKLIVTVQSVIFAR